MANVVRAARALAARAVFGLGGTTSSSHTVNDGPNKSQEDFTNAVASGVLYSRLAADSADTQLSTPLIASGLSVTLAVGTYEVDALVLGTTAALADIQFKFEGTATITAASSDMFVMAGPGAVATVTVLPAKFATSWTTARAFATDGILADTPFYFKGTVVCTAAGTLIVSFAQGTTDATNTHVDAGSYLIARRVV